MPNSIVLHAQEESVSLINKNTNTFLLFTDSVTNPTLESMLPIYISANHRFKFPFVFTL